MRHIEQDSAQDRLDHLKIATLGRKVQRNGTSQTAIVLGVRAQRDGFEYYLDSGVGRAYAPTTEWSLVR